MPVGPSTGSGSGVALDPAAWHTWWELHKEPYLLLKDAIYLAPTSTGSDEFFLGHGEQPSIQDLRPDAQHIVDSVVPALLAILTEDEMSSVVSSATMAVAKIGAEACGDRAGDVEAALRALLESGNQEVVETAVLGLGLFGRQSSAMDVAAVLADTKAGQELTGGGKVTARTRAFAAYGMAELARRSKNKEVARFAAQHLVGVVDSHKAPDVVRLACLNALAVVPLSSVGYVEAGGVRVAPSSSRSALVEWLAAKCKEKKLSDRVRAHAPRTMALHALGGDTSLREEAIGVLVELLARGRTDRELRYGAVMGLGLLGHAGEGHAWVRKSLMRSAREGDATERHLALMSLGQVGSRPGADPKTAWEGADAIEAYLRQQLAKGKSRAKPWAALALGVQGAEQLSHGRTLNPETRDALRMMSQDCKSPADAGAYAVAIGLRTDIGAADILSEKLAYFSDQQARGDICLSLGLLREIGNVPALQEVFTKAVYQPHLLSRVITALTLSQDKSLVPTILKEMEANESSSVRIVYAWALGIVGDARAVEPLTEILLDKENVAMLRAKSADCLGFVCDPERVPWNTSLKRAANYITRAETVLGSGSPGVLEFR
jgi:HEAT repeat protein